MGLPRYVSKIDIQQNEIRDFILRAPPETKFNGFCVVNYSNIRNRWLDSISYGTIHQRINRRSGISFVPKIYAMSANYKSIQRNKRNRNKILLKKWDMYYL